MREVWYLSRYRAAYRALAAILRPLPRAAVVCRTIAAQQPASLYGAIGNALRGIGGGQQRPAQGQGQQKSAGMKLGQPYKPQTIGLQQAQAMFDPGRFYGVLRNAGVRGV